MSSQVGRSFAVADHRGGARSGTETGGTKHQRRCCKRYAPYPTALVVVLVLQTVVGIWLLFYSKFSVYRRCHEASSSLDNSVALPAQQCHQEQLTISQLQSTAHDLRGQVRALRGSVAQCQGRLAVANSAVAVPGRCPSTTSSSSLNLGSWDDVNTKNFEAFRDTSSLNGAFLHVFPQYYAVTRDTRVVLEGRRSASFGFEGVFDTGMGGMGSGGTTLDRVRVFGSNKLVDAANWESLTGTAIAIMSAAVKFSTAAKGYNVMTRYAAPVASTTYCFGGAQGATYTITKVVRIAKDNAASYDAFGKPKRCSHNAPAAASPTGQYFSWRTGQANAAATTLVAANVAAVIANIPSKSFEPRFNAKPLPSDAQREQWANWGSGAR